ncbi:RNA polymerase II C-terminal domain phosphatase-like 4 isoform X1 [Papaver somniferum]|uniref:RNA polymerase II C-terminal domain phosphatase-like 4 isoform X1 n=1 Tax=Papaver somniferum TaxID=3469 RepID=UPI000E6FBEAD|nr:RNA polymerase II C-terminal domain phosphatase-like 4 isoform X1 [Papaver somniferum]XP_026445479.1 RNA polymerase II C-terminal domain phosphatase-like 4 isoform X1 [Papaver somniferum]XP_026445480.1 RNA polymerase II C-terminal domain phosphatase-like 4 isoform X1 [Papaver somniferum]XP_026445481.1 RNA polymerase II C-terminal domain phosphatase-like 4 isoform X1 [Papaver somniferum]
MAPIKLVIKLNGRPICKRKLEIEDHNGLQEEKSSKKVRLLDSGNKVYVIKMNGRPICKRKLEIEDRNGIQEEKSPKKDYLNSKSGLITCMKTVGRHSLYNHNGRYTRLRPYVRDFLEQVCQKFELYVYTKGERWYAKEVVRLIDPKSVYFKNKVISKDDSTVRNRKNLDVVLGANATNTVIIDDTESVWKEHKDNIIRINKFNYFSSRNGGGYRLNMDNDELDEDDGALKRILEVLQRVHDKFFEEFPVKNDVRPVLKANIIIRTSLLLGSGELLSCAAIIGLIQGMHGFILLRTQVT